MNIIVRTKSQLSWLNLPHLPILPAPVASITRHSPLTKHLRHAPAVIRDLLWYMYQVVVVLASDEGTVVPRLMARGRQR